MRGIYALWYWTCPFCGLDCDSEHVTRDDAEACLADHLAEHANSDPESRPSETAS